MKKLAKKILEKKLKALAKLTIKKYRPFVIGVTGSVGKTSTKRAVACLFDGKSARAASGNFNNEIGFPVAILGDWKKSKGSLYVFYAKVILVGVKNLIFKTNYPNTLILEYAADKPGDIKYLTSIAKPDISIVTAVGDVPVHVEFYKSPAEVAEEKSQLVSCLSDKDIAILNTDDRAVYEMRHKTKANVMTFGFSNASVAIENFSGSLKNGEPEISFDLARGSDVEHINLKGVFGKQNAYAIAAAACVGAVKDMGFGDIKKLLENYKPEEGRMEVLRGSRNIEIINDSYNASPLATLAALEAIKDLKMRKVVILGDMRELGKYTEEEHKKAGRFAAEVADVLVFVGEYAELMASGISKDNDIHVFKTSEEALGEIDKITKEGDLVLVKGSRAVGLDKVVERLL